MQLHGAVVVDTNVVSYIHDGDHQALYYEMALSEYSPSISFQTLEELVHGAYHKGWGPRRLTRFKRYLKSYRVVYPSESLVMICAELRANQLRIGRPLSTSDAWIVATALALDCPLATHDRRLAEVPDLKLIQAPDAWA